MYWGIADEQCGDSFRWTMKGLSQTYTCPFSPKLPWEGSLKDIFYKRYMCLTLSVPNLDLDIQAWATGLRTLASEQLDAAIWDLRCRRQEVQIRSLGWEDPLEEEMATHSRTLTWKIPWTEEPGGLQTVGSPRVRHDSGWAHILGLEIWRKSCR